MTEFGTLFYLVESKGKKTSDILSLIQKSVLETYNASYPKEAMANVKVTVDIDSGRIRLIHDGKDITPNGFEIVAQQAATSVLINLLKELEDTKQPQSQVAPKAPPQLKEEIAKGTQLVEKGVGKVTEKVPPQVKEKVRRMSDKFSSLFTFAFWFYNIAFFIGLLTILPAVSSYFQDVLDLDGLTAKLRLLLFVFATLVPLISVIIALRIRHTVQDAALKIFLYFEIPAILMSIFVGSVIDAMLPHVLIMVLFILLTPLIIRNHSKVMVSQDKYFMMSNMFLLVSILMLYAYMAFVFVLVGLSFFKDVASLFFTLLISAQLVPLVIFAGIFGVIGLLLLTPLHLVTRINERVQEAYRQLTQLKGESFALYTLAFSAILFIVLTVLPSIMIKSWPNSIANAVQKYSTAETYEDKADAVRTIKSNADTYEDAIGKTTLVKKFPFTGIAQSLGRRYARMFNVDSPEIRTLFEKSFAMLLYPLTAEGADTGRYMTEYEMQAVLREILVSENPYYYTDKALEPIIQSEGNTAVKILKRKISIDPLDGGLYAKVTVDEEYSNNNKDNNNEVDYTFTLPYGAVPFELKLGKNLEFDGIIAPAGAAQRTYEAQLVRSRDPALLSHTGLRTYRLRVFPIPPTPNQNDVEQKVQFSYLTPLESRGYGMPAYSTVRNAFFTLDDSFDPSSSQFELYFAGTKISASAKDVYYDPRSNGCDAVGFTSSINSFTNYSDLGILSCSEDGYSATGLSGKRIGIFIDTRLRNEEFSIKDYYSQQMLRDLVVNNEVVVHLASKQISEAIPINSLKDFEDIDVVYFGIDQSNSLQDYAHNYDVAIVVTTSASHQEQFFVNQADLPVYLVYKNYVTDGSFEIQHTGAPQAIVNTIDDAVRSYALHDRYGSDYIATPFYAISTAADGETYPDKMAANVNLQKEIRNNFIQDPAATAGLRQRNVSLFDSIYESIAQKHRIVTPISSLLALVNDEQRKQLEDFTRREDRYEDQDEVVRQAPQPVPMPEIILDDVFGPSSGDLMMKSMPMPQSGGGGSDIVVNESDLGFSVPSYSSVFRFGIIALLVLPLGLIFVFGTIYLMKKEKKK